MTLFNEPLSSNSRLFAVDPSLACSGWALFSLSTGHLLGVGKIKAPHYEHTMSMRLSVLQKKVSLALHKCELNEQDILICEAQTTMRDPRAALAVEQVRGIFEAVARTKEVLVPGRINPRTVHHELLGMRGKQLAREVIKESAVAAVATLFSDQLERLGFSPTEKNLKKHQDIVDAILVGSVGVSKIQSALLAGVSIEEMFEQRRRRRRPKMA